MSGGKGNWNSLCPVWGALSALGPLWCAHWVITTPHYSSRAFSYFCRGKSRMVARSQESIMKANDFSLFFLVCDLVWKLSLHWLHLLRQSEVTVSQLAAKNPHQLRSGHMEACCICTDDSLKTSLEETSELHAERRHSHCLSVLNMFFSQRFNIFILRNEVFIETIMTSNTFKKLPFKYTLSYGT